jgi:hypothetical protein
MKSCGCAAPLKICNNTGRVGETYEIPLMSKKGRLGFEIETSKVTYARTLPSGAHLGNNKIICNIGRTTSELARSL